MAIFVSRCRWTAASGVVLLLATGAVRPVAVASRAPSPETLTREWPLSPRGRLVIQNGRGDVTIEAWGRRVVSMRAVKSTEPEGNPALVPIEIHAGDDAVEVSSVAPAGVRPSAVRVDYQIRVPVDTDLKLVRTGHGRVQIAGTAGRATVQVDNGSVRIATAGSVNVVTTNGEIDATVARIEAGDAITLETFNGDIHLRLPRTATPHFEVRTLNGTVQSELPLHVQDVFGPQVAHEAGGADAPFVSLISVSGDIRISRR